MTHINANPLYIGDEVYIGTYRKRFVVIANDTRELWAKEYFKTEDEARGFIKLNGFILITDEIKPWRPIDEPEPVDLAIKNIRNRKSYKMFKILAQLTINPVSGLLIIHDQLDQCKMYGSYRNSVYAKESIDQVIKDLELK
jgi:hypothetical protein